MGRIVINAEGKLMRVTEEEVDVNLLLKRKGELETMITEVPTELAEINADLEEIETLKKP